MYFNFLGGSALLHLLAAHPKVVAALGITATIGLLVTPLGPHSVIGAGRELRSAERAVANNNLVDDETVATAVAAAKTTLSREETESAVRYALSQCGNGCADLTPSIVMRDKTLLSSALSVAALDRMAAGQTNRTQQDIARLMSRR
jgi:hypothetical protein